MTGSQSSLSKTQEFMLQENQEQIALAQALLQELAEPFALGTADEYAVEPLVLTLSNLSTMVLNAEPSAIAHVMPVLQELEQKIQSIAEQGDVWLANTRQEFANIGKQNQARSAYRTPRV